VTFKPHVKATVPTASTVIWRYVDLARFISMLETKSLWFSSIAILAKDDKWEASFPRRARDMWREQSGQDNLDRMRQYIFDRAFVNCWHMNRHESDAMWKLYSHGGNNIVIRSTFRKLREAIGSCTEPISVGKVEYIDHARYDFKKKMLDAGPTAKVLNITPALLWKRLSFKHERELRAFYYTESPARGPETPGMPIFVDLNLLLSEVRVSPRSPEWFRDLIEQLMVRYGFGDVPVKRSSMDDEPDAKLAMGTE
jgi:hypothetical protein